MFLPMQTSAQAVQLLGLSEDYTAFQPARYFHDEQQLSFASSKDLFRAACSNTSI